MQANCVPGCGGVRVMTRLEVSRAGDQAEGCGLVDARLRTQIASE